MVNGNLIRLILKLIASYMCLESFLKKWLLQIHVHLVKKGLNV